MESRISLKDFFGNEATGFTPWLQHHCVIIQDILNDSDICFYKREAKVDDFYIDLMFHKNKEVYVVENQYGESNHDHLGKCIVYSALTNAKKTVWIAEKILAEHQKILDKLTIDLYLCEISLKKIGEKTEMKIYCYSRNKFKQLIYILDKNKEIIRRIGGLEI